MSCSSNERGLLFEPVAPFESTEVRTAVSEQRVSSDQLPITDPAMAEERAAQNVEEPTKTQARQKFEEELERTRALIDRVEDFQGLTPDQRREIRAMLRRVICFQRLILGLGLEGSVAPQMLNAYEEKLGRRFVQLVEPLPPSETKRPESLVKSWRNKVKTKLRRKSRKSTATNITNVETNRPENIIQPQLQSDHTLVQKPRSSSLSLPTLAGQPEAPPKSPTLSSRRKPSQKLERTPTLGSPFHAKPAAEHPQDQKEKPVSEKTVEQFIPAQEATHNLNDMLKANQSLEGQTNPTAIDIQVHVTDWVTKSIKGLSLYPNKQNFLTWVETVQGTSTCPLTNQPPLVVEPPSFIIKKHDDNQPTDSSLGSAEPSNPILSEAAATKLSKANITANISRLTAAEVIDLLAALEEGSDSESTDDEDIPDYPCWPPRIRKTHQFLPQPKPAPKDVLLISDDKNDDRKKEIEWTPILRCISNSATHWKKEKRDKYRRVQRKLELDNWFPRARDSLELHNEALERLQDRPDTSSPSHMYPSFSCFVAPPDRPFRDYVALVSDHQRSLLPRPREVDPDVVFLDEVRTIHPDGTVTSTIWKQPREEAGIGPVTIDLRQPKPRPRPRPEPVRQRQPQPAPPKDNEVIPIADESGWKGSVTYDDMTVQRPMVKSFFSSSTSSLNEQPKWSDFWARCYKQEWRGGKWLANERMKRCISEFPLGRRYFH
ncbi:hypothetical protein QBC43DRAFT_296045 [Cladorrhinum sp. PSN259]|nr:hypothetical protein QBC43DRAFT_296045 [Cladorrhinum sp. PSN259]